MASGDLDRLRRVIDAAERVLIHDHGVGELGDDEAAERYADAVRYRLVLIRDAIAGLSPAVGRADPRIRWDAVAALADALADADPPRVRAAVRAEVPDLLRLATALEARGVPGA
ncbi:MAG: hypothetical protein AB7O78_19745 [Thermoleophilia bacterium]